ncbi:MAG: DUF2914 domain-containing protein [Candidatus Krumholzibacteriia bacterium]
MLKRNLVVVVTVVACWAVAGIGVRETPPVSAQSGGASQAQADHVARAIFTSGVVDREPVDDLDSLATDSTRVFFFTEIVGMEGNTVTHRWLLEGENKAEVPFAIGGPRWRVYSSKNFVPEWTGSWTVEVVDTAGNILGEKGLVYYARP